MKITKLNNYVLFAIAVLMMNSNVYAARVAVTDSGTDFSHEWLRGRELVNSKEVLGNRVDDDRNGKVDDIAGWNFVEGYGRIFFPQHLSIIDDFVFKVFNVIAKIQSESQTPEDIKFWQENVINLKPEQKQQLLAKLNFYGQYSHSTHVSGIIASISPESKIISNRVFPDTPPEVDSVSTENLRVASGFNSFDVKRKFGIADIFYKVIAAVSNGSFEQVSLYLKERQIDVANYSLGVSLQTIAKLVLTVKGVKKPTNEQIALETQRVAAQYEPVGKKWMMNSPQTLFVVAAGNDGSDNDIMPVFPANIKADNSIVVAATQGNNHLAKFSNYGIKSVDIAAPGVAIISSVPSMNKKQLLPMSGTSMAAPYISGVAAKIKDLNPALKAQDLKLVLMSTVDKKEWLKNKVISSGVVNPERAYYAAVKSLTMTISEAIKLANQDIKDQPTINETNLNSPLNIKSLLNIPIHIEMKKLANTLVF